MYEYLCIFSFLFCIVCQIIFMLYNYADFIIAGIFFLTSFNDFFYFQMNSKINARWTNEELLLAVQGEFRVFVFKQKIELN